MTGSLEHNTDKAFEFHNLMKTILNKKVDHMISRICWWNTLEEGRKTTRLVFMFQIIKGLVSVPMNNMDLELSTTKARKNITLY